MKAPFSILDTSNTQNFQVWGKKKITFWTVFPYHLWWIDSSRALHPPSDEIIFEPLKNFLRKLDLFQQLPAIDDPVIYTNIDEAAMIFLSNMGWIRPELGKLISELQNIHTQAVNVHKVGESTDPRDYMKIVFPQKDEIYQRLGREMGLEIELFAEPIIGATIIKKQKIPIKYNTLPIDRLLYEYIHQIIGSSIQDFFWEYIFIFPDTIQQKINYYRISGSYLETMREYIMMYIQFLIEYGKIENEDESYISFLLKIFQIEIAIYKMQNGKDKSITKIQILECLKELKSLSEKYSIRSLQSSISENFQNYIARAGYVNKVALLQYKKCPVFERIENIQDETKKVFLRKIFVSSPKFQKQNYREDLIDFIISKDFSEGDFEDIRSFLVDISLSEWKKENTLFFLATWLYKVSFSWKLKEQDILFIMELFWKYDISPERILSMSHQDFLSLKEFWSEISSQILASDISIERYKKVSKERAILLSLQRYFRPEKRNSISQKDDIISYIKKKDWENISWNIGNIEKEIALFFNRILWENASSWIIDMYYQIYDTLIIFLWEQEKVFRILETLSRHTWEIQEKYFNQYKDFHEEMYEQFSDFLKFIEEQDAWECISTSFELFHEYTKNRLWKENSISDITLNIFWDTKDIIWFSPKAQFWIQKILELWNEDFKNIFLKFLSNAWENLRKNTAIHASFYRLHRVLQFFLGKGIISFEKPENMIRICIESECNYEFISTLMEKLSPFHIETLGMNRFIGIVLKSMKYNSFKFIEDWDKSYMRYIGWVLKISSENMEEIAIQVDELIERILWRFHPSNTTSTMHNSWKSSGRYTRELRVLLNGLRRNKEENSDSYLKRIHIVSWRKVLGSIDTKNNLLRKILNNCSQQEEDIFSALLDFHTQVIEKIPLNNHEDLSFVINFWKTEIIPMIPQIED